MPRGTKKNANQHNNKHENGIVAPGRRITKQRSNGQLKELSASASAVAQASAKDSNTASNSDASSTRAETPPIPAPAPTVQPAHPHVNPPASANGKLGPLGKGRSSSASQNPPGNSTSDPSVGDGKLADNATMDGKGKHGDAASKKLDSSATRAAAVPDTSSIQHVSTIISSRSLTDSLTVLIFLLSLPPWIHVVINALFALATFVPPSGSFSSLPTLSDFVSSFSPATPSFAVIVLIDMFGMFCWQFLPDYCQALFFDSAQAVVATTLGGGFSNKPGTPDNTLWCLGFATTTHIMKRHKRFIYQVLHRTWIGRWTPEWELVEERSLTEEYPVGYERGWFDTLQVFLALHIVCQGLTKMVRRSLYTIRSTSSTLPGGIRDSEVTGAGSSGIDVGEGVEHTRHSTQLRSKESLANLRDVNRDKISSGKRRRKQGNYTRSQQPLWAAFASTKASMAREYLSNDAKLDNLGTGAIDKDNLGDSPFEAVKNKIWITRTQPNSLFFETGPMEPSRVCGQRTEGEEAGIDKTRPFYVRINGADWISMKMVPIPESEDKGRMQWVGEIYGLSPTYSYQVHFMRSDDDTELHSEVIVTPSATISDSGSTPVVASHPLLPTCPASPAATLKVSIAGCEARIEDAMERQRRFRKESKQMQGSLRKEVEALNEKISKQANSVQNLQVRQSRENQHIRQAEDAITTMAEELDAWKEIPEEEIEEYRSRKAEHESTKNEHRDAKSELVRTKENNQRAIQALQAEANAVEQKNTRSQQRVVRLKAQHERLVNPEAAPAAPVLSGSGAPDTERSNSGSSVTRAQQHALKVRGWENMIEGRQRMLQHKFDEYQSKVHELQELQQQQQLEPPSRFRPKTPSEDGQLPGTVPQPPSTGNSRFFPLHDQYSHAFGTPERTSSNLFDPFTPSLLHKTNSTGGHGLSKPHSGSFGHPRPRSTSIMSGNTIYQDVDEGSGGTDGTAFEQFPTVPFGNPGNSFHKRRSGGFGLVREGSNGGSSGSGSPRVLGGITRPPPARETSRESPWHAA